MKGGNEEEKSSSAGPLFPRLHVNDADKGGGPRAPPRNKMALYEQFSIPSQRFSSQASSALPLPLHSTSSAVPSTSPSQGFAHERNLFASYFVPSHTPIHSSERMNCLSSNGVSAITIRTDTERRSTKQSTKRMNTGGSVAECSALGTKETNVKSSCGKKLGGDEDDFRVPTFVRSGLSPHSKNDVLMRQVKMTPFDAGNSKKSCPGFNGKHLEENNNSEVHSIKEANGKSSSNQEFRDKLGKPSQVSKASIDKDRTSTVNSSRKSRNGSEEMYRESYGNEGTARMKMGPSPLSNIRNISRNSNLGDDHFREGHDNKENGQFESKDAEQNDELSESSMVESLSGSEISPDDVVGVIGPKHFWKARRAIVNQQRVFAVQVFELHRLIKVQKLIAASPHILLEANPYLKKSSPPAKKNLPAESDGKSQPESAKQKDHVQRPKQRTEECSKDNTEGNQPLPSHENGGDSNAPHQVQSNGPNIENKPNAWCLHPPPNQWLIPVMSPLEGLIYKPYSGPCPPAGSIMAPLYPSCPPLSLPSSAGDFMNSAFNGAPALPTNYFPPFGWVNGEAKQHSISSSNMSQLNSGDAFSGYLWKFHASKESEIQGSTASSPCKKAQRDARDALPLFPMAPAANESASQKSPSRSADSRRGNPARVIKVVPHNARSASESAARIFRSIQEERHQCEP